MALHDFIDIFDMPDLSNMKEELFHHMLKEQDLQHLSFDNLFKEGKNRIKIFATIDPFISYFLTPRPVPARLSLIVL